MKNIYKIGGLGVVCLLLLLQPAAAQTTYLRQFFTGPGPYTSKSPNNTQFDSIYVVSPATVRISSQDGYVEFERTLATGGGSGRIVRSTDFSPTPSTIYCKFRVDVVSAPANKGQAVVFSFGQNFSPSNSALSPTNDLFARFQIDFTGNNQYLFRRVGETNSRNYGGSVVVTWVMNNTDKPQPYVTPRQDVDTLQPKTYDVWIFTERFLKGRARESANNVNLTDFALQFRDGVGVVRFTDFIIQDIEGINPVSLTHFNAQSIDSQVELNWETAWEQNSRAFVVQRSTDLKEFGNVGVVQAAGETEGPRQYAFTDYNPPPGPNYYRLKMVDRDDSYEYSQLRDVTVRPGQPTLWVAANPTTGERIRVRASSVEMTSLKLSTVLGQDIPFRLNQADDGYFLLTPASTLSPGLYFLSYGRDGFQGHAKVLVH